MSMNTFAACDRIVTCVLTDFGAAPATRAASRLGERLDARARLRVRLQQLGQPARGARVARVAQQQIQRRQIDGQHRRAEVGVAPVARRRAGPRTSPRRARAPAPAPRATAARAPRVRTARCASPAPSAGARPRRLRPARTRRDRAAANVGSPSSRRRDRIRSRGHHAKTRDFPGPHAISGASGWRASKSASTRSLYSTTPPSRPDTRRCSRCSEG